MDPVVRQAQRIQAGIEATQDAVNPGWLLQLNANVAGSVNMHDGYAHYTSEAASDNNLVLTQDRRIYTALVNSGLYGSSTQQNVGAYLKAALALSPQAYWRLGESGNQRVAVDLMGAGPPNTVPNPLTNSASPAGWGQAPFGNNMAGVVVSIDTGQSPPVGSSALKVVADGSIASQGPGILLSGTFKAGVTYTASFNAKGATAGQSILIQLGYSSVPFNAVSFITTTTGWTRYAVSFTPQADTSAMYLIARTNGTLASTFYVNAAMVVQGVATAFYAGNGGSDGDYLGSFAPNLVTDPSFETDTVGAAPALPWKSSGSLGQNAGSTLTVQTTAGAQVGTQALQVVTTNTVAGEGVGQNFTAYTFSAGAPHTLSFYAKGNVGGEQIRVYLGVSGVENANVLVSLTTSWARYSVTWTPAATRVNNGGMAIITNAASAYTYFVDAVQVTQTPNAVPYSDTQGIALGQSGALTGDTDTAVKLDGQSGSLRSPYSAATPTTPLSVEVWVNLALGGVNSPTIAMFSSGWPNNGWWLKTNTANTNLTMSTMNGSESSLTATGVISRGSWYHIVATYDGTTATLYVNGVQVAQGALPAPAAVGGSGRLTFGAFDAGGGGSVGDWLGGVLDEPKLYSYALSAAQVSTLYAAR